MHVVIRKHRDRAEEMIAHLQEASRLRLSSERLVPREHPIWTTGGWKSFLDSPAAVAAAVRYVEKNPVKAGLGVQIMAVRPNPTTAGASENRKP